MPLTAGLPSPCITALFRRGYGGPHSDTIDTDVLIEISVDAPNCTLYFTADGSRPVPFKRKKGSLEFTYKYTAPFCLNSGKRVVRAVAVSRDKLLESVVVSRTFMVRDLYDSDDDDYLLYTDTDTSDIGWTTDSTLTKYRSRTCGRKYPTRKPASSNQDWIACTRRYPYIVETEMDTYRPHPTHVVHKIPDGPFNPTNYSGTQINVWGAPPGSVWPTPSGMVTYPTRPVNTSFSEQHRLLTQLKERRCTKDEEHEVNKPLTVADVRRIIAESTTDEESAVESKKGGKRQKDVTSGKVSFSGLARSGKSLLSSYNGHSK